MKHLIIFIIFAFLAYAPLHAEYITEGETKVAVTTFLDLADAHPDQREDFLFEAGKLQLKSNLDDALITFTTIQQMDGKKKGEAALIKTALLFEMKQFHQIINEKESLKSAVEENNNGAIDLFIGRSLFSLHRYEEAIVTLTPLLTSQALSKKHHQTLLLTLAAAHHLLHHHTEVEQVTSTFEESFSNEPLFANIYFIKALNCKDQGKTAEAQGYLQKILWDYPHFILSDNVRFEYSSLLFSQGQWQKSHDGFIELLNKYPDSPFTAQALPLLSSATTHLLKDAADEEELQQALKKQLANDLQLALDNAHSLSLSQLIPYKLKLAATLNDLKRYDESITLLNSFINDDKINPSLRAQGHILAARAAMENGHDLLQYIPHYEAALALDKALSQALPVHLNLFNAYVELPPSKENEDHAAKHLSAVYDVRSTLISKENKKWLASHFFNAIKNNHDETMAEPLENPLEIAQAEKGVALLEDLHQESDQPLTIGAEQLLYKRACLYGWLGKTQRQIEILEKLHLTQKNNPSSQWFLRPHTQLALANAKARNNQSADALALYADIIAMKRIDPFVAGAARLQFARIGFHALPKEKRTLNDPDMLAILSLLKDLQIQKRLSEEPIHLEASMEYAQIRSSLETEGKQHLQQLTLYNRIKEEYTMRDDIASKDYHDNRALMPEKDHLYLSYLTLLDAHIARLESIKAKESGDLNEMAWKAEAARALYSSLLEKKESLTQYLKAHAQSALDALSSWATPEDTTP